MNKHYSEKTLEKSDEKNNSKVLNWLAAILKVNVLRDNISLYVDEYFNDDCNDSPDEDILGRRFRLIDNALQVRMLKNGIESPKSKKKSFRQVLWGKLRMDNVCSKYQSSYNRWKEANNGINYISTGVIDDGREEPALLETEDFIRSILAERQNGLHLLMAEYGMGKSSFCYFLRSFTAQLGRTNYVKDDLPYSFPLVFNLNEYRDGSFDRFIETTLFREYGISLDFSTFSELCRNGFFCIVLDAWDQMHGTPTRTETLADIAQFSSVWDYCGSMLITCRRSFYTRQLSIRGGQREKDDPIRGARVYSLKGFDKKTSEQFLQQARSISPALMPPLDLWFAEAWEKNQQLMVKPLTLQLLSQNYDLIQERFDLRQDNIIDFDFFNTILIQWMKDSKDTSSDINSALKTLVMSTLASGMNRCITLKNYKDELEITKKGFDTILSKMRGMDYLRIQELDDLTKGTIEFRLAAYQEFFWAKYVIEELENQSICDGSCLLNRYRLNTETRAWVVQYFIKNESKCLKKQINLLAYKNRSETGWSGGNTLTILGDLCRKQIRYYDRQLQDMLFTDRPLEGADLSCLNLSGLRFSRSNLQWSDLSYTQLDEAVFDGADLSEVLWEEYGEMSKCAYFRIPSNDIAEKESFTEHDGSIVVAVENGGILTFSLGFMNNVINTYSDDIIRDLAADSQGVYTAGADGRVGYLDGNGALQNAYIAGGGLQAITAGAAGTVYVSAEMEGLFRYDWREGTRSKITVQDSKGRPIVCKNIRDIHYHKEDEREKIAYITGNRQELVLLDLKGNELAEEYGTGVLTGTKLKFGDICFAGEYLVYTVIKRGVYAIKCHDFLPALDSNYLLADKNMLCPTEEPVELAWADEAQMLLIIKKGKGPVQMLLGLNLGNKNKTIERIINWSYNRMEKIDGFCCSPDGRIIAISGDCLAVFSWDEKDELYNIVTEPKEAIIKCYHTNFQFCKGLSKNRREKFLERGAII